MDDILKNIVPNFLGQSAPPPSPFQAPLLASNGPLPTVPPQAPQLSDMDKEDADTDSEVNANEALANKLTSAKSQAVAKKPVPAPAPSDSSPAPQAGSTIGGMSLDDLQKALSDYQSNKKKAAMIGAVGDLLANRQSAGGILLHQAAPKNDVSGAIQEAMPNPFQNKLALLNAYAELRKNSGMYTQKDLDELNNKRVSLGLNPVSLGQANQPGGVSDYAVDPNSLKAKTAEMMANMNASRSQYYGQMGGTKVDQLAADAAKQIHDNSAISKYRDQAMNIDRGMRTLGENPSVTTMNEVAQDFAQALSGKGVASDFKVKEISTPTIQSELAKIQSYMSSNPNQPAPPDVVKFWKDMGNRLAGAYDRQMAVQAKNLDSTTDEAYANSPNARAARHDAAKLYSTGAWRRQFEDLGGQANAHPQDDQAVKWARANLNDPTNGPKAIAILKANGVQ